MIRIKLGVYTADMAKIMQQYFAYERNKRPERSFWRQSAHIEIRKAGGPSKIMRHVWLVIHHHGGSKR